MTTANLPNFASRSGDEILALVMAALEAMPRQDRNAVLAFLDFWRDLPRENRALFAKSVRPDLSDEEVARLCGVTRRTVYRWSKYQQFKPRLSRFKPTKRQDGCSEDDIDAFDDGDRDGECHR